MIDTSEAQPALDLRRLAFPLDGVTVETLESNHLQFVTDTWMLSATPVDGRAVHNLASALDGVVRRGSDCHADVLEGPSGRTTLHRFLRGVKAGDWAVQADYLVSIERHWLYCLVSSRIPGEAFDVRTVDTMLLSALLSETPRTDAEVPQAWKQYQKERTPGTPNGKFVLFMDPAPVCLGSHQAYLEILRSGRQGYPLPTEAEFRRGGRHVGSSIIEFYSKDDPTSIRVDIWLDSKPNDKIGRESIYSDQLQVPFRAVELWSSHDPYALALEPGTYNVGITVVNRGKCERRSLTHRERFQRDDLERYEIFMNSEARP
jgi:hypothetical protein